MSEYNISQIVLETAGDTSDTLNIMVGTNNIASASVTDDKLASHGVLGTVSEIVDAMYTSAQDVQVIGPDSTWDRGHYYAAEVGQALVYYTYAATACMRYGGVRQGDRFAINARTIGSAYVIYIVDANNVVLDRLAVMEGSGYVNNYTYTVPYDGTMVLNTAVADYLEGAKLYSLKMRYDVPHSLKSPLYGVKWASIGDSLNEFNSTAENNWIKYMIANTGVLNTNLAVSGSGFYRYSEYDTYSANNYISKIPLIPADTELITVAGSFNDLSTSPWPALPVGTASDTGTASLAGYMNDFYNALLTAYPTVPVLTVMTSPWGGYKPGVQSSDDYVGVLGEICRRNGIPFDPTCYYGCNLKPWIDANKTEYYTHPDSSVDTVHPNSSGHVYIYRALRPALESAAHVSAV